MLCKADILFLIPIFLIIMCVIYFLNACVYLYLYILKYISVAFVYILYSHTNTNSPYAPSSNKLQRDDDVTCEKISDISEIFGPITIISFS